ncbi:MAG: GMC family oxidoreductase [Stellaceae bacterium]
MANYVIVGAGSAGCVLAARLTEDPAVEVTLIEAGGADDAPEIHVPLSWTVIRKNEYDWDYTSQPEPGLDGRLVYLPRGKTLGGSSSINAMIYIRGNRADYDGWEADGAKGWSYNELLPCFRKAETNERGEDQFHGNHGPLSVSEPRTRHPLTDAFMQAAIEAGHEANPDFNGTSQDGVGFYQVTQRNGKRCSAAVAYLHPALNRPNLKLLTEAHATRLLFNGNRATGVEIVRNGQIEEIRADTEVILAAGAYNSPQLLLLSGIGPAADLAMLQIPVRHDLPVGVGLQDHPLVMMNWYTDTESLMIPPTADDVALLENEGRGLLASNGGETGAFFRTRAELDAPDVQFHSAAIMFHGQGLDPPTAHAVSFGPTVLKPKSRGKVSLRSANPKAKPAITSNYYGEPEDRRTMIDGMRLGLEIAAQPAMRAHIKAPYLVPESASDTDIWTFVQRHTQTLYHPTCTCAIGRVVDNQLRVHGVDGLRVVDASVMPSLVRGNTNAPTIMIAERAVDLIRGAVGH